nr:hypothetical protein [Brevibacterium casei]
MRREVVGVDDGDDPSETARQTRGQEELSRLGGEAPAPEVRMESPADLDLVA